MSYIKHHARQGTRMGQNKPKNEGTQEEHSVVLKLTTSSKNIARFATATKFLETNDKNERCLNKWTVFLAANQPPNQQWSLTRWLPCLFYLNFRRCEPNHN